MTQRKCKRDKTVVLKSQHLPQLAKLATVNDLRLLGK